jgi:hypothetical protein
VSGREGGMIRLIWGLLAVVLLGVAAVGVLLSFFGAESLTTGANRGPWVFWFVVLVVAPLAAVGFCAYRALKPR